MFFCKSNQSNISLSYLLTFLLSCPCVASTDVYTTLLLLQRTTTTPEIFPLFVRPVPGQGLRVKVPLVQLIVQVQGLVGREGPVNLEPVGAAARIQPEATQHWGTSGRSAPHWPIAGREVEGSPQGQLLIIAKS